jgi:hypothetical protein
MNAEYRRGSCTPHPRPLSPSRGEGCCARFPPLLKNIKYSPRPQRGRGVGGEGARHPGTPQIQSATQTQTRLPHGHCLSSVASVFSVVQKTPLTRHIGVADLGLESPSYVNAECRRGIFTPHPRPLSPARGEGCYARFPPLLKNKATSGRERTLLIRGERTHHFRCSQTASDAYGRRHRVFASMRD